MGALSTSRSDAQSLPVTSLQVANGRTYTSVVTVILALSSSLVIARVLSQRRMMNKNPGLDDFLLVGAAILGVIDWSVVVYGVSPISVTSPPSLTLSRFDTLGSLSIVSELMATWSMALIKTSIALFLLRLQTWRNWGRVLYPIIAVQIATAAFLTVLQATRCIPIHATWNPTITEKWCWSLYAFGVSLTSASAICIATDLIFTLIPLGFLPHIRQPMRDRITIGFLLSLGLLASAAACVKMAAVENFGKSGDTGGEGLMIALWASIEV